MAKSPKKPPAAPALTRAQQRVFTDTIKANAERAALRSGEADAIVAAGKKRAVDALDKQAAKQPTLQGRKVGRYAKRGLHTGRQPN